MKYTTFKQMLDGLSTGLAASGSHKHSDFIRNLSEVGSEAGCSTHTDLIRALSGLREQKSLLPTDKTGKLAAELKGWMPFLESAAKSGHRSALQDLLKQIERLKVMPLSSLLAELRTSLLGAPQPEHDAQPRTVDDFVQALQETKHDGENFPKIFKRLENDLNRADTVEVASRFAFKMAKSTTKKKALERIWDQHAASKSMQLKVDAQGGKSAA